MLDSMQAVSYTHLDVDKRQFPDDPTANINAAAIELQRGDLQQSVRYLDKADAQASATLNNRGVLKPVSYTHLDVYKRQQFKTVTFLLMNIQ